MTYTTRPLHDHQRRALAAAAGLVGRPRLRAGLALTLAVACTPLPDDSEAPDEGRDPALTSTSTLVTSTDAATSTLATSTDAPTSTGPGSTGTGTSDASTGRDSTGGTLLTDASTTLATDTGDTTGTTGTTGELDDCILDPRTMEMDWDCCAAQDWQPAPQCTPWGPPAPPSAARLLQARAARRVLA